ncbi:MAG: MATE family efflux transporter [Planctomycetales bacterium]|nr:MATE family efflux transporter [Planctomycetales bacterium]
MADEQTSWWTRPCGGRDVLRVALPLVISTGFFSLMLFVDRLFLFWHSKQAMAAAMPAGMLHWTMVCFPIGVATYANTFVAQYHGAKRPERIGATIGQAAWLGVLVTPLFLLAIPLAPWLFHAAGEEPIVRHYEIVYFRILTLGSGAAVISGAVSTFFTGRGETRIVMLTDVSATLINAVLDYALIFGKFGLPELGMAGAAWATVASHWFKLVIYWWLIHRGENATIYQLRAGRRLDWPLIWRMVRYGAPSGLQMLVEGSAFTLVLMKMRGLGTDAMTATTVALSINSVAFIPLVGLSIAVSTLVGQRIAQGQPELAARTTWSALTLGLFYTGAFGVLYLIVPDVLLAGYAMGGDPVEYAQVRAVTIVLLRFGAAFCLFDAIQMVFVGAIKGAGDTWYVLIATIVVSCAGVIVGWIGSAAGGGLYWWWTVITLWTWAQATAYAIRFLQGRWRTMRVIEYEPEPKLDDESTPQLEAV